MMNRRDFILKTITAAGVAALDPFPYHLLAGDVKKYATDKIKLGNTGITVSRLAMGTGTNGVGQSSNQTRQLGVKGLGELLHAAYDNGVFFFDTADQYGSHPHVKEALKYVPREKVVILTKTHAATEKEMKEDLDRFRQELGTDYLDIVLLHCMMEKDWPTSKKGAMDVLSQSRESGIIKAHGVSCHTFGALQAAAASDWVQVDLARINPAGKVMDASVPKVVEVLKNMKTKGKAIIGMKIFAAGGMLNRMDESLQYALSQDFVDCFTIGQDSQAQMKDLLTRIPAASTRG
jgi:1-deoxyxylulose-5-phosphate synthase